MTPMYDNIKIIELDRNTFLLSILFIDLTGVVPAEFDIEGMFTDWHMTKGSSTATGTHYCAGPECAMGERVGDTELEPARIFGTL